MVDGAGHVLAARLVVVVKKHQLDDVVHARVYDFDAFLLHVVVENVLLLKQAGEAAQVFRNQVVGGRQESEEEAVKAELALGKLGDVLLVPHENKLGFQPAVKDAEGAQVVNVGTLGGVEVPLGVGALWNLDRQVRRRALARMGRQSGERAGAAESMAAGSAWDGDDSGGGPGAEGVCRSQRAARADNVVVAAKDPAVGRLANLAVVHPCF